MEKKEYTLIMTEDGEVNGKEIANRKVYSDFLPMIGESVVVKKGRSGCCGEVTSISHLVTDDGAAVVCVICKFIGASV